MTKYLVHKNAYKRILITFPFLKLMYTGLQPRFT